MQLLHRGREAGEEGGLGPPACKAPYIYPKQYQQHPTLSCIQAWGCAFKRTVGFKQALCSSKGEHGELGCASSSILWLAYQQGPRAAPCKCITSSFPFLQDLGITKVGHMKRILQAIKELSNLP